MLSFFPRGVLDEILNLIESVSEEFPSHSSTHTVQHKKLSWLGNSRQEIEFSDHSSF